MAKKIKVVKQDSVRRISDGVFTKFYAIDTKADETTSAGSAMRLLANRDEYKAGMIPGYCIIGNQNIIGFKNPEEGVFISY
jgi:hypothetical protein